jgi:hypothetical protein
LFTHFSIYDGSLTTTINLQVMSSRTQAVAGSEAPATPEAKAARKGDDGQYGAAVEAVKDPPKPEDPHGKLLDLLTNLAERMERLEASMSRQEEYDSRPSRELSIFESAIGLGRPMDRHALDKTPPPRDSLVSPGTYFGVRQNGYGHEAAANVEMAQAPQPALPAPAHVPAGRPPARHGTRHAATSPELPARARHAPAQA